MFGLGFQEILLLALLALLLFGAKRLPDVGRAVGQSIREFKKAMHDDGKSSVESSTSANDGDKKPQ